jgi:hypothetical protein
MVHISVNKNKKFSKTEPIEFTFLRSFEGQSYTVTNYRHWKGEADKGETRQKKWTENNGKKRK